MLFVALAYERIFIKRHSTEKRFVIRDLLLPTAFHGLTTATVSLWVHLILSSNLSRKFRTWHPVTTTQHLSWKKLHWLPISERVKYKVACMCFSAINGSGPAYLSELLHVYTPSRTLRSSSDIRMLEIQQYKRKTHGFRTFSCFGPHIWNSLPQDLRLAQPQKLKTFLFSQYFHPN